MDSYIAGLKAESARRTAQRAAVAKAAEEAKDVAARKAYLLVDPRADLRTRVARWWETLPLEGRAPRYLLEQLTPVFRCTQQQLGVVLFELGWRRKRVWKDDGPYRRYWSPPADAAT